MPLISTVLQQQIEPFFDQQSPLFAGFPHDTAEVADKWSAAVGTYMAGVIPASTTVAVAQETFKAQMLTLSGENGATVLVNAFTAAAAQLALGMTAAGFTGVPPAAPLVLDPVFAIGNAGGSNADVLAALSSTVDAWMKTGIATLIAPPNTPMPWS